MTIRRRYLRALRRLRPASDEPPSLAQTAEPAAWERFSPLAAADDLAQIVDAPDDAVRTWLERKPAAATYLHPTDPQPTSGMRSQADALLTGTFSPHRSVPDRHEPLPPSWDARRGSRRTEELYRHALRWLEPLISVAYADDDRATWTVARGVIESWIEHNSQPPWRSAGAWHDHAASIRVRILCWCFELHRRRPDCDPSFLTLLAASIHQHGLYLADDANYAPRSNHALESSGSLLAACLTVPELTYADAWAAVARSRLDDYTARAFSDDGFSKEQSPRYHLFIMRRLGALVGYLAAVDAVVPEPVRHRLWQATAVWPWLVRDDGVLPRVGDTNDPVIPRWRDVAREVIVGDPPPAAPSSAPNPRDDRAAMLVSFDAGYAVLRGNHPDAAGDDDTHILFKCNYFNFPHFHHDGLSFVFFAHGREWLIDPGPHSYEYQRWERRYLVSSSAHNVVEVGGPFDLQPVELVDVTRDDVADRVTVRHLLPHAVHTRTLEHRPRAVARIVDEVEVTDGVAHPVRQLFHVHPDCTVAVDGRRVTLTDPQGRHCTIDQTGHAGTWEVVRGQREPETLGWYSPGSMRIEPVATCIHRTTAAGIVRFETIVRAEAARD